MASSGPRYFFGLLETPGSSATSGIVDSGHESTAALRPPQKRCLSSRGASGNSWFNTATPRISTAHGNITTRGSNQFSSGVRGRHGSLQTPGVGVTSTQSRTPGSRRIPIATTSSATPAIDNSSVIVAVAEGRGAAKGEVGIASIDLRCPVLTLSQFSDSSTYVKTLTKIQHLQPLEIVLPDTSSESTSQLFKLITDTFQDTYIAMVPRKYFNEDKGMHYIKQLCLPQLSCIEMEIRSKYYCLCGCAALLKYVEYIQNVVYASSSLKVIFKGSEKSTMIDAVTAAHLELLQNLKNPCSLDTLFGVLNATKTRMGSRLLSSNIIQPLSDVDAINLRLDAVAELLRNEETFYDLQTIVGRFIDIDHLLSACVQIPKQESLKTAESKITNIIYLKHTLELIAPLKTALSNSENALFSACKTILDDPSFDIMSQKIHTVINDDTHLQKNPLSMRMQKCFAVKPEINGLLDVSRRTYSEVVDDIHELVQNLAQVHNLPLKTSYNPSQGFHMSLRRGPKEEGPTPESLPGQFIKVTKFKSSLTFTCMDLMRYNDRAKDSLREIYLMSNIVMSELLVDIRQHLACLYKLSESVALLDMLLGFTHNCTVSEYVRPEFTDTLAIKAGRHPILDQILTQPTVPNNAYASEETNFIVVTGPNMSGKSTYLRQIAQLQVMAQVGSFVPAEYASFRIADQIFSRIGGEDNMEMNSSSFTLEMQEMNYIIQNASASSLIVIDELGKSTSADEGVGLCHAICEYLLNVKSFTFFATHFSELTKLEALYHSVANYHFEVQREFNSHAGVNKMYYTHTLSKGSSNETSYGIHLAEASMLPREVIARAKQLRQQLADNRQKCEMLSNDIIRERAVFKLGQRLVQTARNSRLDETSLRSFLHSLKQQYRHEVSLGREEE